jgi:CMP-N-acetylneuraminic acid synthetase
MQFVHPEYELSRTQDFETTFHDAGQFYMGRSSAWISGLRMHTAGLGMPIPAWRVVDIDDEDSWRRAELLHEVLFPGALASGGASG